uniref:DUF2642 domain-containing protein n=1 Tax=Strongyloides venezuelensis TaxID=75913 RepID=A0A0K0G5P8_STRVS
MENMKVLTIIPDASVSKDMVEISVFNYQGQIKDIMQHFTIKTPTGALLFSENRNISITIENDLAIVHYRSTFS